MKTRAVVVSVGARTPIGLEAQSTGMLYRAAVAAMRESPLLDPRGEPVTFCMVPTLDPRLTGARRALQLATPALDEALKPLAAQAPHWRVRLLLCMDEHLSTRRPDGALPARDLADDLARHAAGLLPQLSITTSVRGPAGLGFCLDEVLAELEAGTVDAAVVGGVHTDYEPDRIAALWEAGRLFSPDNIDALIPGETAAFAVLMRSHQARSHRLEPRAGLVALATAIEKARPDNDEPAFEAAAMTTIVRQAAEPLVDDGLRVGWMLTDLTFESMRLFELQAMTTRTQACWCEPQQLDAPGQRLGYLGAAAMPLHLVLASEAWRCGWAPHGIAFSLAGSDGGERAALLVTAAG